MDKPTVIVAVLALFIAVWQVISTRKHNRLSVRPKFRIDSFVSSTKGIAHIFLRNCGTGPGIIAEYNVIIDGTKIIDPKATNVINHYKVASNLPLDFDCQINSPTIGDTYQANDSIMIFQITVNTSEGCLDTEEIYGKFREELKRWAFEIKYKSIYEEKFDLKVSLAEEYS